LAPALLIRGDDGFSANWVAISTGELTDDPPVDADITRRHSR
jgi:hypothetical protein